MLSECTLTLTASARPMVDDRCRGSSGCIDGGRERKRLNIGHSIGGEPGCLQRGRHSVGGSQSMSPSASDMNTRRSWRGASGRTLSRCTKVKWNTVPHSPTITALTVAGPPQIDYAKLSGFGRKRCSEFHRWSGQKRKS